MVVEGENEKEEQETWAESLVAVEGDGVNGGGGGVEKEHATSATHPQHNKQLSPPPVSARLTS